MVWWGPQVKPNVDAAKMLPGAGGGGGGGWSNWQRDRNLPQNRPQVRPGGPPWQSQFQGIYQNTGNRYAQNWDALVKQAGQLGQRDYSADLQRMASEDLQKQYQGYQNSLSQQGMSELAAAPDVQAQWAKMRQDALTRAQMSGDQMKRDALAAATSTINTASGRDLDAILAKLQTAQAGAEDWYQAEQFKRGQLDYLMGLIDKFKAGRRRVPANLERMLAESLRGMR